MIKILRYSLIVLAGILTSISLISNANTVILLISVIPLLLWLFASQHFAFLHNLILPVYVSFILSGMIYGNSPILQIMLLVLILTTWDIDSLYIDSKGIIGKKDEWRIIKPLLVREVLTIFLVFISMGISTLISFSIGFWTLVLIVLLLIFILRKLFQFNL